ncbi:MAG: bifunctional DNA primase/polymerase [Verrucomicrobiota bacterium JB022]|nr:bifunctional DNA primase/polymerase [Verrucomicrobiota bacterium JB022]
MNADYTSSLATARALRAQGVACIPVDLEKRPCLLSWKEFRDQLPTESDLSQFFANGSGIAIVAGAIQCIDIDVKHDPSIWERYIEGLEAAGCNPIIERLVIQRTPSGGWHFVFRTKGEPIRNVKLARKPDGAAMIETRGDGGYFLIAPSKGYSLIQGDWDEIPTISDAERESLLEVARSLDERQSPREHRPSMGSGDDLSPGDAYDAQADTELPALLRKHGWEQCGRIHWTRPGKTHGVSASWNQIPGRFWVFTTSTQFEAEHSYRPWHVFAILECGGDYRRAAAELKRLGFGSKPAEPPMATSPRESLQQALAAPPGATQGQAGTDILKRIEALRFRPLEKPPEPTILCYVAGVQVLTNGNLGVISGQAKSGKSAFLEAHFASAMAPDPAAIDSLGVYVPNPYGKAIIHLDTEQSAYDHWQLITRAQRRAETEEVPPWFLSYCLTGMMPEEIMNALEALLQDALETFGGVHSVFIDGTADLVHDPNDTRESFALVRHLMALANTYDCGIVNVIHLNPGSESKTRGHLGSQLERKAESNLRLEADKGVTQVWSEKQRRSPIKKGEGPVYRWSVTDKCHRSMSVDEISLAKTTKGKAPSAVDILELIKHHKATDMSTDTVTNIISVISTDIGVSKRTIYRKVDELKSKGLWIY